ncbi:unknown protein [Seminavis robusta]|uniref:Uncharacterized protein n=1 Tax=Seminavis robusta TaxID=568900 RepID=A0A9N8E6K0_9STRA|nr:unknown protein [Seminavis robusta]|eukprot:Sro551_g164840.1 n/a (91) ;mRNA; f:20362-20634
MKLHSVLKPEHAADLEKSNNEARALTFKHKATEELKYTAELESHALFKRNVKRGRASDSAKGNSDAWLAHCTSYFAFFLVGFHVELYFVQ